MQGVLLDLDGTLLDIDLDSFLRRYFGALTGVLAELVPPGDVPSVMDAIMASTEAMAAHHPGATNRDVFYEDFHRRTGIDLHERWPVFERFYREDFPALGDGAGPCPGAARAVETALELGMRVAVATNPIFPRAAVDARIAWAGLDSLGVEVVTTYEIMHACKPHPAYFEETAAMLGLTASACLMVGDDRSLDLPAASVGMRTFYTGSHADAPADFRGSLDDLADLLPRLVGGE